MKLSIEIREESHIKSYISVLAIGILECIEKGVISYDDVAQILFSPYAMQTLEKCPDISKLIHMGTELEDISSIVPESLEKSIIEMKEACCKKINFNLREGERHIHYELIGHYVDWGNPKSEATYGTTFIEHGSHHKEQYLKEKARAKSMFVGQYGQWTDDQKSAEFIAKIAVEKGFGTHDVPLPPPIPPKVIGSDLPKYFPCRVISAGGLEGQADMARVIVNQDGSVKVAYPFNSRHPH